MRRDDQDPTLTGGSSEAGEGEGGSMPTPGPSSSGRLSGQVLQNLLMELSSSP